MKKSWKLWWIVNGAWLLLFIIAELFILLRPVDDAGNEQTKIITTLIMLSIFALPVLIQLIWLVINIILTPSPEHKAVK